MSDCSESIYYPLEPYASVGDLCGQCKNVELDPEVEPNDRASLEAKLGHGTADVHLAPHRLAAPMELGRKPESADRRPDLAPTEMTTLTFADGVSWDRSATAFGLVGHVLNAAVVD